TAVRQDEDAERAPGLDEARRGDRLPRGGRMTEAEAPHRARIWTRPARRFVLDVFPGVLARFVVVLVHVRGDGLFDRANAVAVPVLVLLVRRDQLRQHPRERVHLMAAQLGTGREMRRLLREDPLQPEHQREADLPLW